MQHTGRLVSAALILISVGLRTSVILRPPPINIDEARYLVAAHHLRSGVGYSDWRGPEIDIHPLHPALVAILGRSVGSLETRGRAVTFVCSLMFLWPLGALAWRLGGPKASALFLLLAGTHPWLARASASVQPESLYVLLTAAALVALWPGEAGEIPMRRWTLAGALFGLAYLARPEAFLIGVLVGGVVFLGSGGSRRGRLFRFGAFAVALLMFASPYLVFLRWASGEWIVTGKTAELFFVGQALYDSGGTPPEVSAYVSLMERWKGVLPYVAANPAVVGLRAAHNAVLIGGWALPLALGPAGLAGILGCAAALLRRQERRLGFALVVSPALTLLLMLLTFRNDRVIGSVLPFLFVVSAAGLAAVAGRLDLWSGRRYAWTLVALAVTVSCLWLPAAVRAAKSQLRDRSLDRRAADMAVLMAASPGSVASNNPALSFYVGDPFLFGPPGRYTPLRWSGPCRELADDLHGRGAQIAVLDGGLDSRVQDLGSDHCPLHEAAAFEDLAAERRIAILSWK
jgi:hypothetical protein